AKLGDGRCDFSHMRGVKLADLLGRRLKLVERQVSQLEMRKDVIAPRAGRSRCGGKPLQAFTPRSALCLQLIRKRPRAFNFLVTTIGQALLHCTLTKLADRASAETAVRAASVADARVHRMECLLLGRYYQLNVAAVSAVSEQNSRTDHISPRTG